MKHFDTVFLSVGSLLLFTFLLAPPSFVHAQEPNNPSLIINTIDVPSDDFNTILRNAPVVALDGVHGVSWQITIDNNLLYEHSGGNAVLRFYDQETYDEFIEVGMGAQPDYKFWVAVQTPKEGYVVVHRDLDRGWYPQAKSIVSFTDRAGLTVNNGARIVVTNLDIGKFVIDAYSAYGMESLLDPPAINSGIMTVEFLSGDPAKNQFALFPFYIAAGMGVVVGVLFLTKRRSS